MLNNSSNLELVGFKQIVKNFGGVRALKGVSFSIKKGEIHGLVGENGAGKSTLVKICTGVFPPDSGTLLVENNPVAFSSPAESELLGIRVVHQDIAKTLCVNMSVADNIFLGPLPATKGRYFLDRDFMHRKAHEVLEILGIELDPRRMLGDCSPALQQLVLISRAFYRRARLIIMDEPTSSLSQNEVETLFTVMRKTKEEGTTFLFVSHRLGEVIEMCDNITVLKDGEYIDTFEKRDSTIDFISTTMTGKKELSTQYKQSDVIDMSKVVLKTKGISSKRLGLHDISFQLHKGEILGIAGLMGSGRTELLSVLFGIHSFDHGEILVDGRQVRIRNPWNAIQMGFGLINEDRNSALFYNMNLSDNIASAVIDSLAFMGWINRGKYFGLAKKSSDEFQIAAPTLNALVSSLSGGNQQKVVISRWLATHLKILLCDEPTRGVDVGVKSDIRNKIVNLSHSGVSIIYVSSDFDELLRISDRIILILQGEFVREFGKEEIESMSSIDLNNEVNLHLSARRTRNQKSGRNPALDVGS